MRNKIIVLWILGVLMVPSRVLATPPESVELNYNQSAGILTVSGRHPTQDRFEHFIRRVRITRNQDEPQIIYLTRQDSVSEFQFTTPVQFEPGDMVRIEVFCSQGGSKVAEIQIPNIVQKAAPGLPAEDLKSIKDKDHQNMPIIP